MNLLSDITRNKYSNPNRYATNKQQPMKQFTPSYPKIPEFNPVNDVSTDWGPMKEGLKKRNFSRAINEVNKLKAGSKKPLTHDAVLGTFSKYTTPANAIALTNGFMRREQDANSKRELQLGLDAVTKKRAALKRNLTRDELNDTFSKYIPNPTIVSSWTDQILAKRRSDKKAEPTAKEKIMARIADGSLLPENLTPGEAFIVNAKKTKPVDNRPTSIKEFEFAKKGGWKGTFFEWKNQKKNDPEMDSTQVGDYIKKEVYADRQWTTTPEGVVVDMDGITVPPEQAKKANGRIRSIAGRVSKLVQKGMTVLQAKGVVEKELGQEFKATTTDFYQRIRGAETEEGKRAVMREVIGSNDPKLKEAVKSLIEKTVAEERDFEEGDVVVRKPIPETPQEPAIGIIKEISGGELSESGETVTFTNPGEKGLKDILRKISEKGIKFSATLDPDNKVIITYKGMK